MSSRVTVNGRVVIATGELARLRSQQGAYDANAKTHGIRVAVLKGAEEEAPLVTHEGPREGVPWTDDDGTVYRVIASIDFTQGWVHARTIMKWYAVSYIVVAQWVRHGLLDGARTRESPTKWYRVLDPAKCTTEAANVQLQKLAAEAAEGERQTRAFVARQPRSPAAKPAPARARVGGVAAPKAKAPSAGPLPSFRVKVTE